MDVEEFRHGGANITGFRLVNTTSVLTNRAAAPTNSFRWQPASESRTTISVFRICLITPYALQRIGHESDQMASFSILRILYINRENQLTRWKSYYTKPSCYLR